MAKPETPYAFDILKNILPGNFDVLVQYSISKPTSIVDRLAMV